MTFGGEILTLRHKRIVQPLDTGKSEDWNDDHTYNYENWISWEWIHPGVQYFSFWDLAQSTSGSQPSQVFEDNHFWFKASTGATTDNISTMRAKFNGTTGNITHINDYPVLIFTINLAAFHTAGVVYEFGLFSYDASPFTSNQNGAYFRVKDNKLYAVCGNGTAETETEITGITLEQGTYLHLKIELTTSWCKFYVNDMATEKASITTNLPSGAMTIKLSARSQNNVDTIFRTEQVGLHILRKR